MADKPSSITGTGTINDPYIVHNYDEIKWACEDETAIPEGQSGTTPVYLKLNNNIDCQEYDQDFEWEITCQHAVDINLNNKTIKTFYIVANSYMFIIPAAAANFNLHDGAILNVYGNWFDPSKAIFNYTTDNTYILTVTNVSWSINISQLKSSQGFLMAGVIDNRYVQFTNCAITLEGASFSTGVMLHSLRLFTCDIMITTVHNYASFVPCYNCILQDCRLQGFVDLSNRTNLVTGYFASDSIARNCVFDLEMRLPTTWTKSVQFFTNTTSIYNYGIYNKDKLPDYYTFENTTYIECTTHDMDMRVNPHADTTLQEKGFDVIKG